MTVYARCRPVLDPAHFRDAALQRTVVYAVVPLSLSRQPSEKQKVHEKEGAIPVAVGGRQERPCLSYADTLRVIPAGRLAACFAVSYVKSKGCV